MLDGHKLKGVNNPAYRHGKTIVDYRTNVTYRKFIKYVYERDNYKCNKCGDNGSKNKLNVHHIYDRKHYPELTFTFENGITLYTKCHKEFHKLHDARLEENNIEQIQEFLDRYDLIL